MNAYNVLSGEYPFDNHVGIVFATDELEALKTALSTYGHNFPHCVVELVVGD